MTYDACGVRGIFRGARGRRPWGGVSPSIFSGAIRRMDPSACGERGARWYGAVRCCVVREKKKNHAKSVQEVTEQGGERTHIHGSVDESPSGERTRSLERPGANTPRPCPRMEMHHGSLCVSLRSRAHVSATSCCSKGRGRGTHQNLTRSPNRSKQSCGRESEKGESRMRLDLGSDKRRSAPWRS